MSVIRVNKNNNYSVINNQFLNDDKLSWKAKGIMAWLLSRPDNWQIYMTNLESRSIDGLDSVRSGIKELMNIGYISRKKVKTDKGTFSGWEYVVFETPISVNPITENPTLENPTSDNPTLISTDIKQVLNKVNTNINILTEILAYFNLKANRNKYQRGSERATLGKYLKSMVKNGDTLDDIKTLIDYKLLNPNTQKIDLLAWLNNEYVGQNMALAKEWHEQGRRTIQKFNKNTSATAQKSAHDLSSQPKTKADIEKALGIEIDPNNLSF